MDDFERRIERSLRRDLPIYEYMDFHVECASNGVYRCSVPLNERTSNQFHTVHAALQWASVEALGGLFWFAAKPPGDAFIPLVKRFEIDFKRPAGSEITAEAHFPESEGERLRARLAEDGRFDFVLDSTIRDSEGVTVAIGKGFYVIRSTRVVSSG